MPNWCSNSLHFEGNPQRIAEVAEQILVKTEQGYRFSFQHILPMPEELEVAEGSGRYDQQYWLRVCEQPQRKLIDLGDGLPDHIFSEMKQYFSEKYDLSTLTVGDVLAHFEENPEIATRFGHNKDYAQRISENIRKYAYPTWYGWRLANWGCKWDVSDDSTYVTVEANNIWISFETAWEPPQGIYEELAKRFPDVEFEAKYLEEGMWFAGSYEGHEGALFDYPCEEDEVRAFAIEHFGCEYDDDENSE